MVAPVAAPLWQACALMFRDRPLFVILALALTLGLLAWMAARGQERRGEREPLRLATWNMEWLLAPETARTARLACRDGRSSPVPCDVTREARRDSADLAALARIVARLDADVIAFQEVENAAIARRVFRGYQICITQGSGVQQLGFAVREGLAYRCEAPLASLAADARGRAGQPLTLFLPGQAPIELLAVHLKSGCSRDPLDSPTAACRLLEEQARALGEWIRERGERGTPFIVLGDLNRAGAPEAADAFWSLLHAEHFETAASRLPYSNCVFGAPYEAFIDHVLVARSLTPQLHSEGYSRLTFRPAEAVQYQLSDHCPVSVSLRADRAL